MPAARKVVMLQTCSIFDSLTAAAAAVKGASPAGITRACTGERIFSGCACWRYADELLARAAEESKTLRQVCDEELAKVAVRAVYGGAK